MAAMSRCLGVALASAVALGCGSGGKKVNYAKVDQTKKIAIVGVCALDSLVVARGMNTANIDTPQTAIESLATGLDAALPSQWQGVQVTPFKTVASTPGLPKKEQFKRRRCAGGLDPFMDKGFTGDPDKALLGNVAKALGVDAVVVFTSNLGVRFGGSTARFYNGGMNPMYVYAVDKDGELIITMSMKGLDSADVPTEADYGPMGMSYGNVVAGEFIKRLKER